MVGLGVERSRRSPTAGEEEAARVRCEREGHGMGEQGGNRWDGETGRRRRRRAPERYFWEDEVEEVLD